MHYEAPTPAAPDSAEMTLITAARAACADVLTRAPDNFKIILDGGRIIACVEAEDTIEHRDVAETMREEIRRSAQNHYPYFPRDEASRARIIPIYNESAARLHTQKMQKLKARVRQIEAIAEQIMQNAPRPEDPRAVYCIRVDGKTGSTDRGYRSADSSNLSQR